MNSSFSSRRLAAIVFIVCMLCLPSQLWADALADRIDGLLDSPNLEHGIQAVVVKSMDTGDILYERNADLTMMPASNLKLLVSAAALDLLGPAYTYKTNVSAPRQIGWDGIVRGDLVLRGAGDPTLSTSDLADLARQLKSAGLLKITGDILIAEGLFDAPSIGQGWAWDYLPYYYAAPAGALNLNRNTVEVYVSPGKSVGSAALVRTVPATNLLKVESTAVTDRSGSGKSLEVYRKLGTNTITVSGSIAINAKPGDYEELITVTEPGLYAGEVFKTQMVKQGITVVGGVKKGRTPEDAQLIATHSSPPLSEILALLNKPSDNLIAEVLLKTIGAASGRLGTTESGIAVEMQFLKKAGAETDAVRIVDGSGLSRLNNITAYGLLAVLEHMYHHKHGQVYLESLPIAGVDGTLRNRMKGTAAQGNVRAKSGYVTGASSLSGFVDTRSGKTLAFSILMNNHLCSNSKAKAIQNKICEVLATLP